MQRKSTYGLRLDQMANLFLAAEEPGAADEEDQNQRMASLLQEQLTRALPQGSLLLDTLFMMLNQEGCDTRALAGRSLGEVFLDPQSDVNLLQAIKNCSKRLSCALDCEADRALATTLYFAALASALVHHDQRITQIPYEELDEDFASLREKEWMNQELVRLFADAQRISASRHSQR